MRRSTWIAGVVGAALLAAAAGTLVLIGPQLRRGPSVRPLGEARVVGGFDSHLEVAVTTWIRVGPSPAGTGLVRYRATVTARNTASDLVLDGSRVAFEVRDGDGRRYPALSLPATDARGPVHPRLPARVPAGTTHAQDLHFVVPDDVAGLELWIWTDDLLSRWLPLTPRNPLLDLMRVRLPPRSGAGDVGRP